MGGRGVAIAVFVLATPVTEACSSSSSSESAMDGDGAGMQRADAASGDSGSEPGDSTVVLTGDAGTQQMADGGVAAACDQLFDAWVACSLVLPAAAAHNAPRFRQFCEIQAALPGSTTTAAEIEACARAFAADCSATCQTSNVGTLPAGSPCNIGWDLQCQSGSCAEVRLADGGYSSCGVCAASIPVGQPCVTTDTKVCVQGSYCAAPSSGTCVTYGDAGAPCSPNLLCQPGLVCSSAGLCEPEAPLGHGCSSDVDCAQGLPCVGGTCSPRADAGAHCTVSGYSTPCAYGLECDTTTSTCVAPTVQPGGACGSNGQLCVFGQCIQGACPTIVADGQPCPTSNTAMCDVEAQCDSTTGKCAIPGSTACR
jgi:hypothetical protein